MTDAPDPTPLVTAREGVEALKACPFCGSTLIERGGMMDWFWTKCLGCHNSTAKHPSRHEADAAWNRRCAPAAEPGPGEWSPAADLASELRSARHDMPPLYLSKIARAAAPFVARAAAAGPGDVEALVVSVLDGALHRIPPPVTHCRAMGAAEDAIRAHFPAAAGGGPTDGEQWPPICDREACRKPLERRGVVTLVPTDDPRLFRKYHFCADCEPELRAALSAARKEPAR